MKPKPLTRGDLYKLDWIKILSKAIEGRPTSWNIKPVLEWRNASDEICFAVVNALEEEGLINKRELKIPGEKMKPIIKYFFFLLLGFVLMCVLTVIVFNLDYVVNPNYQNITEYIQEFPVNKNCSENIAETEQQVIKHFQENNQTPYYFILTQCNSTENNNTYYQFNILKTLQSKAYYHIEYEK
jgi:hypothetical protein